MTQKAVISVLLTANICFGCQVSQALAQSQAGTTEGSIYHDGWNDLNKNGQMDPYENPQLDIEKRIDDLLARMTLEEKTCQMATLYGFSTTNLPTDQWLNEVWKDGIANIDEHINGRRGSQYAWPPAKHALAMNEVQKFFIEKTRLGIPVDFSNEGIHGLRNIGTTCFPAPIALGCMWDRKLIDAVGRVTAREAKALGYTNVYAPILDIAMDPRWGRVFACYSEEPYLISQLGMAMVKALQSEGVASTPKHFGVYSIPKGGRDGTCRTDPKASRREMETVHLAPFRAAIKEAGALGVMSSYNDYDGIPITGSKEFLTDILREKWGFKGYVVSDSKAVLFIYTKHRVVPTYKDAIRQAVEAGLNVRTGTPLNPHEQKVQLQLEPGIDIKAVAPKHIMPETYINPLRELVKEGKISIKTIDERVRGVLRVKYILGLFDHPYVEDVELSEKIVHCKEHQDLALETAHKSIVLLKNQGNLLPLSKDVKSILVTGPNANISKGTLGSYGPENAKMVTVLEGIKSKVSPNAIVKYVKGCDVIDKRWPESEILPEPPSESEKAQIEEAARIAKTVDVAVVVVGGNDKDSPQKTCGESCSRTSLNLPGYQLDLVKAVYETGTPTVVVLLNGRALTINWTDKYIPAIVEAWYPGENGGQAVADVLFGDYNPGGKLSVTFPKTVGQIPLNFPYKRGSQDGGACRVSGVLYPFGHGLSYTEFKYSGLQITPKQQRPAGNINVSVDIENIGERKGDEVVQLYIKDVVSSVVVHALELRGFERVTLKPGQKKTVSFTLRPADLQLLDHNMQWVVEPGTFDVLIGSSSVDIRLKDSFEIIN